MSADAALAGAPPRVADVAFPQTGSARVFHFIQGKAAAVRRFLPHIPAEDLVLAVTYDGPIAEECREDRRAFVHWPKSSWAEGRNFGAEVAQRLPASIRHVAFLDDDVAFASGDYAGFVSSAIALDAAIATPVVPRTNRDKYRLPGRRVQAGAIQDQQILIFRREVLSDPLVWPMTTAFDGISWHVPCLVQEYVIWERYAGRLAQLNDFVVRNDGHSWEAGDAGEAAGSSYVMDRDFHKVRQLAIDYLTQQLGRSPSRANDIFMGARGATVADRVAQFWWKKIGRRRHMARLLTSDGDGRADPEIA